MTRKTFTPDVTQEDMDFIKKAPEGSCFVMEQIQPIDMWDPTVIDLVPHRPIGYGSYDKVEEEYEDLKRKARVMCEDGVCEWFSRGEGKDFVNFIVFSGTDVIITTMCTKEKALALAL